MFTMRMQKLLICLGTATSLLWATPFAFGASRTVYFNASGMNRTVDGLSASATSICKITLSNPSSVSQSYTIASTSSSINDWPAGSGGSATVTQPQASCTGCGSGTLAANASVTVTVSFTAYPARPAATVGFVGKQQLRCTGSIIATDSGSTNPGYMIASGTLVTFVESARMNTDAVSGGTSLFGGIAVYTQVPMTINRGKPF